MFKMLVALSQYGSRLCTLKLVWKKQHAALVRCLGKQRVMNTIFVFKEANVPAIARCLRVCKSVNSKCLYGIYNGWDHEEHPGQNSYIDFRIPLVHQHLL